MKDKLNGLNILGYLGVEPYSPPLIVQERRAPTTNDVNYNLGSFWYLSGTENIYVLMDLALGIATWVQLSPGGGGGASTFPTDNGIAAILGGLLQFFGDNLNITTRSPGGNQIFIDLADDVVIQGTFQMTALGAGVVQQTNAGFISDNGTDGQLLIGATGGAPAWASIMSAGGTITITPGPNTLNLEVNTTTTIQFDADTGTAIPDMGIIIMPNTTNINTTGAGNTVTINLNNDVTIGNNLTTSNGLIATAGGLTVGQDVTLSALGTGVLQSDAMGVISSINGTDGQTLIGGGTNAIFANLTSSTITITNGPNSIDLSVAGGIGSAASFLGVNRAPVNAIASGVLMLWGQNNSVNATIENFDIANAYFQGDGVTLPAVYTAPVTGKYYIRAMLILQSRVTSGSPVSGPTTNTGNCYILTSNEQFSFNVTERALGININTNSGAKMNNDIGVVLELDLGDTVEWQGTVVNGTQPFSVTPGTLSVMLPTPVAHNWAYGYLVT